MATLVSSTFLLEVPRNGWFSTRLVPFLSYEKKSDRQKSNGVSRSKRSLCLLIFRIARGKVSDTPSDSRGNFGPRLFCCMPRISDTYIRAKALPSMTFLSRRKLLAKMQRDKCKKL